MSWNKYGRRIEGWTGPWPGRGPFSDLPPWQRSEWLHCGWPCRILYDPRFYSAQKLRPEDEIMRARYAHLPSFLGKKTAVNMCIMILTSACTKLC